MKILVKLYTVTMGLKGPRQYPEGVYDLIETKQPAMEIEISA